MCSGCLTGGRALRQWWRRRWRSESWSMKTRACCLLWPSPLPPHPHVLPCPTGNEWWTCFLPLTLRTCCWVAWPLAEPCPRGCWRSRCCQSLPAPACWTWPAAPRPQLSHRGRSDCGMPWPLPTTCTLCCPEGQGDPARRFRQSAAPGCRSLVLSPAPRWGRFHRWGGRCGSSSPPLAPSSLRTPAFGQEQCMQCSYLLTGTPVEHLISR